ncbi:MAG: phosphate ABC transporter ATP-binding protein PstB [Kiritimatiellaeota bacterium]|nr:phosphate ABC transporter ATP-binding protein PstB [Kiritimatiellota bacterium]
MKMDIAIQISNLDLFYGAFHALKNVNLAIEQRKITALIGPSGCGKSTLLRALNRMNDLIPGCRTTGAVLLEDKDIYGPAIDVCELRKKVGMVFQRPNPFPLSIRDNVTFGLRVAGRKNNASLDDTIEKSLQDAWLWEQVKDKLDNLALELPLDQQQRLCIARVLAVEPDVILMDEPCSALDPISTAKIEELMLELRRRYTIAIVTHNMQQAARISDYSAYMLLGEMIEFGVTTQIFENPKDKRTEDYITGRYG